jgi:hypothetical protein
VQDDLTSINEEIALAKLTYCTLVISLAENTLRESFYNQISAAGNTLINLPLFPEKKDL